MLNLVVYCVISFCKIMLGFLIFVQIFPEKRWNKRWVEILGWCILVGLAADQAWDSHHGFIPWLQIIINGCVSACMLKIFYQCKFFNALLWNWLYDIGYSLLKIPFMIIRGLYLHQTALYLNVTGGRAWAESLLCFFQLCVICFLYFRCMDQVEFLIKRLTDAKKIRYLFLLAEIIVLYLINRMLELGISQYETMDIALAILLVFAISASFLLYIIYTLYTCSKMEKRNLEIQREILARENEIITQHCRQDAKRLHDLKHTWMYLQECLEEKEYGNALECVKEHLKRVELQQRHTWTGISEIDLILDYKHQQMKEYGIQFSVDIEVYVLPVSGENFMIILGNLLDNAIESNQKCEISERKIHLVMKNVNEMFLLRMGNTCLDVSEQRRQNQLRTTKDNRIYHGWGMENVKQIVKQAGGELTCKCKEKWFEVNILV